MSFSSSLHVSAAAARSLSVFAVGTSIPSRSFRAATFPPAPSEGWASRT